jgi:hypothetical protein
MMLSGLRYEVETEVRFRGGYLLTPERFSKRFSDGKYGKNGNKASRSGLLLRCAVDPSGHYILKQDAAIIGPPRP